MIQIIETLFQTARALSLNKYANTFYKYINVLMLSNRTIVATYTEEASYLGNSSHNMLSIKPI